MVTSLLINLYGTYFTLSVRSRFLYWLPLLITVFNILWLKFKHFPYQCKMLRTKVIVEKNVIHQRNTLWRIAHTNAKYFRRKLQKINAISTEISFSTENNLKKFHSFLLDTVSTENIYVKNAVRPIYSVSKIQDFLKPGENFQRKLENERSCFVSKTYHNKSCQQKFEDRVLNRQAILCGMSGELSLFNNVTTGFGSNLRLFSTQADKSPTTAVTNTELLNNKVILQSVEAIGQYASASKQPIEETGKDLPKDSVQPSVDPPQTYQLLVEKHPILQTFSAPKNVLHNIFQILCQELGKTELRLNPQYKLVQNKSVTKWACTYNLKWPEVASFTATSDTKKDASKKAAIAALTWLKNNNKIDKIGQPIIYDKSAENKLTNKKLTTIKCNGKITEKMNEIVTEFHNQMLPHIIQTKSKNTDSVEGELLNDDEGLKLKNSKMKYLGQQAYIAKEQNELPISQYKKDFIDLLKQNRVLIIKGEPGCGKSTRIPQYVLEHWAKESGGSDEFCRIAVTQPRRIAAISLAERVAHERGESTGDIVGYHVRFKSSFSKRASRILYCTTGILLRHLQTDLSLEGFTYVLLDEAHERDINTDLLMNLLKRTLTLNPKLKVIIMSATIDTDIFKNYFDDAPVMVIPGFTYPVKSFYLESCRSLDLTKTMKMCQSANPHVVHEDVAAVIKHIHHKKSEGAILVFLPGWDDISKVRSLLSETPNMNVLCLHSRLQDSDQYKIFSRPPPGIRKVILATNIAETSVTIDDVVYVVDAGIHKESRFDVDRGVMCIDNHWISQASMTQRRGRAGRVQPGECFHLYPRSKAESFEEFTVPEILKTSLTKVILDSKVFSNNQNAIDFMHQLLTPPDEASVISAVEELKELELLDSEENLTPLGRALADFQLEPKLSKAMVNSVIFKCVTPVVDIATIFSSETELFTGGLFDKDTVKNLKRKFSPTSDHLALMRLFEKWHSLSDCSSYNADRFCNESGLVAHKMGLIAKLRNIHFDYLHKGLYDVLPISDDYSDNDELVKAVILCGVGNFLQHRNWDLVKGRYKTKNTFLTRRSHRATISLESVNSKCKKFPSDFLVYINETRSNIQRITLIRESSIISPLTLLLFSSKNVLVTEANLEDSPEMVELSLIGTNVRVLCDRQQAKTIVDCKDALFAGYKFYINLLTQGGDYNPKVNKSWDHILSSLNNLLTIAQVK